MVTSELRGFDVRKLARVPAPDPERLLGVMHLDVSFSVALLEPSHVPLDVDRRLLQPTVHSVLVERPGVLLRGLRPLREVLEPLVHAEELRVCGGRRGTQELELLDDLLHVPGDLVLVRRD